MFYEPMTRSETVKFRVKLDRAGIERHAEALTGPRLQVPASNSARRVTPATPTTRSTSSTSATS